MAERCDGCGRFRGEDHDCPMADLSDPGTCKLEGCTEPCRTHRQDFCGHKHYSEWRARRKEENRPTCTLPDCDEPLDSGDTYCSPDCQHEAMRERGRKRREENAQTCALDGCDGVLDQGDTYCSQDCANEARRAESPNVETDSDLLDYTYAPGSDGEEGVYYFPVNGRIYPIGESTWEYVCKQYSEMGGDLTRKEVAREVGISFPVLKRILRLAGQFKASLPFSRERIADEDADTLVEEALETKERKIIQRLQRKEQQKLEREHREMYKQLQDEERHVEAARKIAREMDPPEAPDIIVPPDDRWPACLAPTTDEHLGLPVWGEGSWGENYDTDIAARRIVAQGKRGAEWLASQGGADIVYRPYTGDLFNAIFGSTTHDTPMDQDTRDERVWDLATQAVLRNAQSWRQVCDRLVLIFVSGNHDGPKVYQFASTMRFALDDEDDVEVRATPKKYDAVREGETLHVFDHGANLTKLSGYKAIADAETVARKAGGEKYHGAEYILYHVGHKHDRMVVTQGDHMEVIRHPALCESSEYEHENRWVATPCADVLLLDDRGRIATEHRLHRDQLDAA